MWSEGGGPHPLASCDKLAVGKLRGWIYSAARRAYAKHLQIPRKVVC